MTVGLKPRHSKPGPSKGVRELALLTGLGLLIGCSSPPPLPPLPPPRVVRSVSHEVGGALAAGTPRAAAASVDSASGDPWVATLHVVALESLPERGEPLVDHLRLISRTGSPRLLETRLEFLTEARFETFTQPAAALAAELTTSRATPCGRLRTALLPGTATLFDLAVDHFASEESRREGVTLRLALRGGSLEICLVARHAPRKSGDPGQPPGVQEEIALLEPFDPAQHLLLLLPAPFDPGYEGYALALEVAPATSRADAHLAHYAESRTVRTAAAPVTSRVPTPRLPTPASLSEARAPDAPAQAWSVLAQEAGADLSERLALAGAPSLLEEARPHWQAALEGPLAKLAWRLEQASVRTLLATEESLARPLLLDRCGAVGSEPGALRDTLDLARGLSEWEQILRQENRYLLRNALTGVRARAFTWLALRGLSPVGYDPFGSREERREALRKAAGS